MLSLVNNTHTKIVPAVSRCQTCSIRLSISIAGVPGLFKSRYRLAFNIFVQPLLCCPNCQLLVLYILLSSEALNYCISINYPSFRRSTASSGSRLKIQYIIKLLKDNMQRLLLVLCFVYLLFSSNPSNFAIINVFFSIQTNRRRPPFCFV